MNPRTGDALRNALRAAAAILATSSAMAAVVRVLLKTGHRRDDWRVFAVLGLLMLAALVFAVLGSGRGGAE